MKLIRLFCLPLLALALSLTACHDSDDNTPAGIGSATYENKSIAISEATYWRCYISSGDDVEYRYLIDLAGDDDFYLNLEFSGKPGTKTIDISDAVFALCPYGGIYTYYTNNSYYGDEQDVRNVTGTVTTSLRDNKISMKFDLTFDGTKKLKGEALISKKELEPSGTWVVKQAGIDPATGEEIYVKRDSHRIIY